MNKLSRLIASARESATSRGHKMQRFTHEYEGRQAYSYCDTGCGMGAFVQTRPMPNDIDISGRAVAVNCPNAEDEHASLISRDGWEDDGERGRR